MKKGVWILAVLLMLTGPAMGTEIEEKLPTCNMEKLRAGELQIFFKDYAVEGKGKKQRVVGMILLDAPLDKIWKTLNPWEDMEDYVPGLEYSKTIHVVSTLENGEVGEHLVEAKLNVPMVSVIYTLNMKLMPSKYRTEYHLLSEKEIEEYNIKNVPVKKTTFGLKSVEGYSYYLPVDDSNQKTIYVYSPIVEVSIPLPGFIERYIAKKTLVGYMEGVKKKVESLK